MPFNSLTIQQFNNSDNATEIHHKSTIFNFCERAD